MSHVLLRAAALAVSIVTLALPAAGQRIVRTAQAGPAADPILLPNEGLFQARFASVGDDLFIGGQPTEAAPRELSAKGVTTVVNLRMPEEMAKVGFDEAALIKELGLAYVHIPMRGTKRTPTRRPISIGSRRRWPRREGRSCSTARWHGGPAISGLRI